MRRLRESAGLESDVCPDRLCSWLHTVCCLSRNTRLPGPLGHHAQRIDQVRRVLQGSARFYRVRSIRFQGFLRSRNTPSENDSHHNWDGVLPSDEGGRNDPASAVRRQVPDDVRGDHGNRPDRERQSGQTEKKWLKTREVRKLLEVSPGKLQWMRKTGFLSYMRIGGSLYYDPADIDKMFEKSKVNPKG